MMKDDLASGYASSASEHVDGAGDKYPDEGECMDHFGRAEHGQT
jgi:hypothetical protein